MSFDYRFSRVDQASGKHKGVTATVGTNVVRRSVDYPNGHLPYDQVLLDHRLVITINVNQVEAFDETVPYH